MTGSSFDSSRGPGACRSRCDGETGLSNPVVPTRGEEQRLLAQGGQVRDWRTFQEHMKGVNAELRHADALYPPKPKPPETAPTDSRVKGV